MKIRTKQKTTYLTKDFYEFIKGVIQFQKNNNTLLRVHYMFEDFVGRDGPRFKCSTNNKFYIGL